MAKSFIK